MSRFRSGAPRLYKKILNGLAALLAAACLAACGGPDGGAPEAEAVQRATTVPVVVIDATATPPDGARDADSAEADRAADAAEGGAPEQTPEDTPAPTPIISVTTGRTLPSDKRFQPVLAVIGNAPQTRPQTGLMRADIIYELSMDRTDHSTRLIALFSDNVPARVGPIQDARFYFFDLRREWDAMLVYDGYPKEEGYPVYDPGTIDFPAAYSDATAQYFVQDRTVGSEPENTLFCKLSEMQRAIYGTSGIPASSARFQFQPGVLHNNAKPIVKVGVPFTSSDYARVEFVYNPEDNMLYRYERNSKGTLVATKTLTPAADGASVASEPLRVQNLIVQYVKYEDMFSPYRSASLISNGNCDYFVNGRHSAGRWSRASLGEPTVYQMRDGSPLVLEPGTTWIVFHTLQRDLKIQYGQQ